MLSNTNRLQKYFLEFRKGVTVDAPLYFIVAIYAVLAFSYAANNDFLSLDTLRIYTGQWLVKFGVIFPFFLLVIGFILITLRLNNRRRLAYRYMFGPERVGRYFAGMLLFVAILIFQTGFTTAKISISAKTGFLYDLAMANIDKAIHFGTDPWQFLYSFAQNEIVLRIVEINYNSVWFIVNYGILFWFVISPRAEKYRVRYISCFIFTWAVLGSLFAALFASGGPAYFGAITGDIARFGEQMNFLAVSTGKASSAIDYQNYLWALHETGKPGFGSGISAFPSVHVGLTAINALFVFEYSRKLGLVALAYLGFVLLSSVYLAWHYAIDGYFSIAIVLGIYFGVKKIMSHSWRWGFASTNRDGGKTIDNDPEPAPVLNKID